MYHHDAVFNENRYYTSGFLLLRDIELLMQETKIASMDASKTSMNV